MMAEAPEVRPLARIAKLMSLLGEADKLMRELEAGKTLERFAAEDPERWGIVAAAVADAQDVGQPGTVAGLLAVLYAATAE